MSWDADRVRIELCRVMTLDRETCQITAKHGAHIWLSDDEGKIRARKPAVSLVDESRPALLRQIAGWIESRGDDSLAGMVAERQAAS